MTDPDPALGPGAPTPPIALTGGAGAARPRTATARVEVGDDVLRRLSDACSSVTTDADVLGECSRDWWPLAMTWALDGEVPGLASAVARPASVDELAQVLAICDDASIPLTAAAGRSGVCGGSVPVHGGVVVDLTSITGVVEVDDASLLLDVRSGTFGDHLEHELRASHGLTLGHWPQSVALSTVGGWLACRGAGQLSTRYGKIEDMVVGLEVALSDGSVVGTGGNARAASGPDLNQLFVGSEGTLGIITRAQLRLHPAPAADQRLAFGFPSFEAGLEACRRILRRGARPAVLRLYDAVEGARNFGTPADLHPLLVLDEGDPLLVAATMRLAGEECVDATPLDTDLVERWLAHRNEVGALEGLIQGGLVVDTMEITGSWAALPAIYRETVEAIRHVEHTLAASAHQSHAYGDGACLYFTFAGKPPPDGKDRYYREVWDVGTTAVLARGGSLSHHHGVGMNRARFMRDALGDAFGVLVAVKQALDPRGILNPGKLGLPSPFGKVAWP